MAIRYEEHPNSIIAIDETKTCVGRAWGPTEAGEWLVRFGREDKRWVKDVDAARAALRERFGEPGGVTS